MKKIFKYALLLAIAGTMSFSFSSCSESDPNSPTNETTEVNLEKVTQQYVNDVVFVTYSKLADQSEQLFNKLEALRAKLNAGQAVNQSEIDALCDNYKEARKIWEASEAFLYGAADEKNIDPHIDTWPLDVETLAKDLEKDEKINKLNKTYDLVTVRKEITDKNLGFHGIEFVLFRNGKNRPASFFNNNTTEDYEFFTGKNVTAKEEVIYAYNVAGDLRDKCYQLEVAWLGDKAKSEHIARINECAKLMDDFGTRTAKGLFYGQDLLLTGSKDSQHPTWQKVMETILEKGCSNICGEVADQKMGQAYRAIDTNGTSTHKDEDTGEDVNDRADWIESPYSYNSFTDFYDNIMSIQNSLYGNYYKETAEKNSIMNWLTLHNADMAKQLQAKLSAALSALDACKKSGKAFVQDPHSRYVKEAMDKVSELDDYLGEVKDWILKN